MRIIVRTITEEFWVDEAEVNMAAQKAPGSSPMDEGTLIELFELYDNSQFGMKLFSNVSFDVGYKIEERAEDD